MHEYRCTRNSLYRHNCIGRDDIRARQGYYVEADNEDEARRIMAADFPKDTHGFTVTPVEEV
jgi:hypothetical protein